VCCRAEAQRSAKQLVQLEKEREKYSLEASEANARYMQVSCVPVLADRRRAACVRLAFCTLPLFSGAAQCLAVDIDVDCCLLSDDDAPMITVLASSPAAAAVKSAA
jgi:hypothetical protein